MCSNPGGTRDANGTWTGLASLETVPVGDAGNVGELSGSGAGGYGEDRICGSVSYTYNIGKYEVTAGQYTEFLNKVAATDTYGLYNTSMSNTSYGSGITQGGSLGSYAYSVDANFANRPVNYVSWGDAAPGQDVNDASGNNANYWAAPYAYSIDSGKYTTVAGEFQNSDSPYGTFDHGGNVFEWNEAILSSSYRGLRGGSFLYYGGYLDDYDELHASGRSYGAGEKPSYDGGYFVGFRVSQVPEPASMAVLALGGIGFLRRRSGQVLRRSSGQVLRRRRGQSR